MKDTFPEGQLQIFTYQLERSRELAKTTPRLEVLTPEKIAEIIAGVELPERSVKLFRDR